MPVKKPEMFERPGLMLRISLQRFAEFATGRIRCGGHDSAIYVTKSEPDEHGHWAKFRADATFPKTGRDVRKPNQLKSRARGQHLQEFLARTQCAAA